MNKLYWIKPNSFMNISVRVTLKNICILPRGVFCKIHLSNLQHDRLIIKNWNSVNYSCWDVETNKWRTGRFIRCKFVVKTCQIRVGTWNGARKQIAKYSRRCGARRFITWRKCKNRRDFLLLILYVAQYELRLRRRRVRVTILNSLTFSRDN